MYGCVWMVDSIVVGVMLLYNQVKPKQRSAYGTVRTPPPVLKAFKET